MITKEYPADWAPGKEPYYPVNDAKNQELYQKYADAAAKEQNVIFGGRLAEYKYYDMDKVIASATGRGGGGGALMESAPGTRHQCDHAGI